MSRSYLFVPGNTPSMIQNLDVFDSDAVILDLEDSIVYYEKDAARILVHQFLQHVSPQTVDVFVRVNDCFSEHFTTDVIMMDQTAITGYVLPKASPQAIQELIKHTTKPIIAIIESPRAVLDAKEIAANDQIIGLLLGAEDLTKEMNIPRTTASHEIEYARHYLALVCHAYNIEAIDTPWIDKDNLEGLQADAEYAKSLGFTGKAAIHPNHVTIINDVYTPTKEEILQAKRIVLKAQELDQGAFSMDGTMVDRPIIEKAKKLLEQAKQYHII